MTLRRSISQSKYGYEHPPYPRRRRPVCLQSARQTLLRWRPSDRMCGSLKFSGSVGDYILRFALQPSEAMLFRCDGQGGVIPVGLDELSIYGLVKTFMKPPADHLEALALICGDDQELAGMRDVTITWLANHHPGLSDEQLLGHVPCHLRRGFSRHAACHPGDRGRSAGAVRLCASVPQGQTDSGTRPVSRPIGSSPILYWSRLAISSDAKAGRALAPSTFFADAYA